jgi:hypothetical protein
MEAIDFFRRQADECRRLANDISPSAERQALLMLARHYDVEAKRAPRSAPSWRDGVRND